MSRKACVFIVILFMMMMVMMVFIIVMFIAITNVHMNIVGIICML